MSRGLAIVLLATALPFVLVLASCPQDPIGLPAVDPPIPGDSDVYEYSWHFWWVGTALSSGLDPRFCPLAGQSPGTSLAAQNLGWPDVLIFGLLAGGRAALALNFALLSGSLFSCLGGWFFAKSWDLRPSSCALAAFLCAWAPVRIAHVLQHYQIASTGFLLFTLAFSRLVLRGGNAALAVPLILAAALAGLESPYHGLMLVPGVAAVIALSMPAGIRRVLIVASATVLGTSASFAFYESFPGGIPPVSMGLYEATYWSADVAGFLLPGPFGVLSSAAGMPVRADFMPNPFDGVVTPGIATLALLLLALFRRKGRLLILAGSLFCLLALGPRLKILGTVTGIPLPYRILLSLPLAEGARSSARFALLAAAFFCIPAANAFGTLPRVLKGFALAAVVLEMYMPVLPVLPGRIPSAYVERTTVAPVLEIPASPIARRYIFFQTADGAVRPVFLAGRGSLALPAGFAAFEAGSLTPPTRDDARAAGLGCIVYNRWMMNNGELAYYDSLYSGIFGTGMTDSVEIWIVR